MAAADEAPVGSCLSSTKEDEIEGHGDPQLRQESVSVGENPSNNKVKSLDVGEDGAPEVRDSGMVKEEVEEEGECPFCLFMKSGPCGEDFTNWEKCVEEADKEEQDIVTKCWPVTQALRKCMEANIDYYGIVLQAEQAMEERTTESEKNSARDIEDNASEQSAAQASSKEMESKNAIEDQVGS